MRRAGQACDGGGFLGRRLYPDACAARPRAAASALIGGGAGCSQRLNRSQNVIADASLIVATSILDPSVREAPMLAPERTHEHQGCREAAQPAQEVRAARAERVDDLAAERERDRERDEDR